MNSISCTPRWLLSLVWVGWACAGDVPADLAPSVAVEDGIEVAVPSAVPSLTDPRYEWEFRVLREAATQPGGAATDPLLFNPRKALPLEDGTLLVHDPQADEPLVLMAVDDGSVLRRFGRNGRGPGELSIALDFSEAKDGSVHVLDRGNRQVHVFAPDGSYRGSERLDLTEFASKTLPSPDGLSHFAELTAPRSDGRTRRLARLRSVPPEVAPVMDLPSLAGGVRAGDIQRGRVLWSVVGRNVVAMRSDVPVVMVHDFSGKLVREIHLPLTRRTITEGDIREQVAHHGDIARTLETGSAALTNELYAVNDTVFGMFLSALWRAAEDPPLPVGEIWWRMFSTRGAYVGVARVPDGVTWLWQGGERLWAAVLTEAGLPVIQELTLVRRQQQ